MLMSTQGMFKVDVSTKVDFGSASDEEESVAASVTSTIPAYRNKSGSKITTRTLPATKSNQNILKPTVTANATIKDHSRNNRTQSVNLQG